MPRYNSICPVCGEEFENSHYQSQTHCSVGCQFYPWEQEDLICIHRHLADKCIQCKKEKGADIN